VLKDLQVWMDAVVPQDGRGPLSGNGNRTRYLHNDEADEDMPAHIRTALIDQTVTLSIDGGCLLLGVWQWGSRSNPMPASPTIQADF